MDADDLGEALLEFLWLWLTLLASGFMVWLLVWLFQKTF